MRVAANTCREQEAIQREIAETSPLENRRKIATAAATAWAKEAIEADKREARELKRRALAEAEAQLSTTSGPGMSVEGNFDAR